jgi:branched-chain amino acid transport system substrate-binding protein
MKQFAERGMDKAGIKLIATGDVTDDDQLNDMGDVALGVVTRTTTRRRIQLAAEQEVRRGLHGKANNGCAPTSWPWAATTACA